jgi:cytosine/adenosine deaminase-related metal-dependent hydrolase
MTQTTLIIQTTVLTLDDQDRILTGVDVAQDGDRIAAVGALPPGFEPDMRIDGRNLVASPAFFNAHTQPWISSAFDGRQSGVHIGW